VTARFGSFELDSARRQLFREGLEIHLTPKAFDLLSLLVEAAPAVVSKARLHEQLWRNGVVSDATLTGLVKEIRRALHDRDRNAPLIRTAHRIGYALNASIERLAAKSSGGRWLLFGERRVALVDGENVIGRDLEAHVQLNYSTVSRRHARLVVTRASTVLEDLGSKNGTTMGGARLDQPVTLRSGDRFVCGPVLITYSESSAAHPTVTRVDRMDLPAGR
jgi:DNA-binding winged helix-turn-helix (wHTH) protein